MNNIKQLINQVDKYGDAIGVWDGIWKHHVYYKGVWDKEHRYNGFRKEVPERNFNYGKLGNYFRGSILWGFSQTIADEPTLYFH